MNVEPASVSVSDQAPESIGSEDSPLLVVGLSKVHRSRQRTTTAFENVELSLSRGEIAVVLGPSGCGKSSLLRCIAGLEPATRGTIRVGGRLVSEPIPQIGFVFQQPILFPWLTVRKNIEFGLALKNGPRPDKLERSRVVEEVLADVGLSQAQDARPRHLSGGMAQRIALARTLVREPEVLLLDEPFSSLDAINRLEMQKLLLRVVQTRSVASLLVTHDIDEALFLGDRILLMGCNPGRIAREWRLSTAKPRFHLGEELTDLLVLAKSLCATQTETVFRVILPSILGHLVTGFRLAIGIAWIVLVPAEMLGVRAGLGYYILDARDRLSYSELVAVILVIGAIGYTLDTVLRLAERFFTAQD
jgi:NitT/TauT family transport system ATP-binding protein